MDTSCSLEEEVAELLQQVVGKDSIREPTGMVFKTGLVWWGIDPPNFQFSWRQWSSSGFRGSPIRRRWRIWRSEFWVVSFSDLDVKLCLLETYFMGYFFALYRNSISSLHMSIGLSQIDGRYSFSLCFAGYLGYTQVSDKVKSSQLYASLYLRLYIYRRMSISISNNYLYL